MDGPVSTAAAIGYALHMLAGNWGIRFGLCQTPSPIRPIVEQVLRTNLFGLYRATPATVSPFRAAPEWTLALRFGLTSARRTVTQTGIH